ncbi:hypothetical protein D3C81_1697280 [compost metagenome]
MVYTFFENKSNTSTVIANPTLRLLSSELTPASLDTTLAVERFGRGRKSCEPYHFATKN